ADAPASCRPCERMTPDQSSPACALQRSMLHRSMCRAIPTAMCLLAQSWSASPVRAHADHYSDNNRSTICDVVGSGRLERVRPLLGEEKLLELRLHLRDVPSDVVQLRVDGLQDVDGQVLALL